MGVYLIATKNRFLVVVTSVQMDEPAIKRQKLNKDRTEIHADVCNNDQETDLPTPIESANNDAVSAKIPQLPNELLVRIFKHVEPSMLSVLSQCSRNFRQIAWMFKDQWPKLRISLRLGFYNHKDYKACVWGQVTTHDDQFEARRLERSKLVLFGV